MRIGIIFLGLPLFLVAGVEETSGSGETAQGVWGEESDSKLAVEWMWNGVVRVWSTPRMARTGTVKNKTTSTGWARGEAGSMVR